MNSILPFRSNRLYIFGLMLVAAGLPVSMFLMSMSQFVLAGAFFLEGNFLDKFKRFFRNKAALIIAGILVTHVIGMLWTTNTAEGWKDIRIKLPLLVFTVIISGSQPLTKKEFHLVIGAFITGLLAGTFVSMAVLLDFIHHDLKGDIRNVFIFNISHIRFSLMLCIAIFATANFIFVERLPAAWKYLLAAVTLWFIVFLFIVESLTGLSILILVSIFVLFYYGLRTRKSLLKIILLTLALAVPAILSLEIYQTYRQFYTYKDYEGEKEMLTAMGNPYTFDSLSSERENGYPVWDFVSEDELRTAWNLRSDYPYDSLDQKGQRIKYTLIRFLTSKGWKKDAQAVQQLSSEEVKMVEHGTTNIQYSNLSDVHKRLYEVMWEYDQFIHKDNPSGHSVIQRLEFWKAAAGIIKAHPLTGVGTGDMPEAYREQYIRMDTRLEKKYWVRAHNQFLAIAVALGIPGLLYFIFALIYPGMKTGKMRDYFYLTFLLVAVLSMLSEDTIETQAGATFFAFFNALYLFGRKEGVTNT